MFATSISFPQIKHLKTSLFLTLITLTTISSIPANERQSAPRVLYPPDRSVDHFDLHLQQYFDRSPRQNAQQNIQQNIHQLPKATSNRPSLNTVRLLTNWAPTSTLLSSTASSNNPNHNHNQPNNGGGSNTGAGAANRTNNRRKKNRTSRVRKNELIPELDPNGVPLCLNGTSNNYCEEVANYPQIESEDILYRTEEFKLFFSSNEELDSRKSFDTPFLDDEQPVCKSNHRLIYPKVAKNRANQWMYIVNNDQEYVQAVMVEICEKPGKGCNFLDQALPFGAESQCKQKFSYKRLVAIHPKEKTTTTENFKFPSCCACYVKMPLGRSGL